MSNHPGIWHNAFPPVVHEMLISLDASISTILLFLPDFPFNVMCNVKYALCRCLAHKTLCAFGVVLQGACFTEVVLASGHDRVCKLFPRTPADVAGKWQAIVLILAIFLI